MHAGAKSFTLRVENIEGLAVKLLCPLLLSACGATGAVSHTWMIYGSAPAVDYAQSAIDDLNAHWGSTLIVIDKDTPNTITLKDQTFLDSGEAVGYFDGIDTIWATDFSAGYEPLDAELLQRRTVLHELGHAFGLGHVFKASAIMSPDIITADIPEEDWAEFITDLRTAILRQAH